MTDFCPLCKRELGDELIEKHHLMPKTFGGKDTYRIHKICHRKIHSLFTERELKNWYHTFERILEHEDVRKFVSWVKKKPLNFYDSSNVANRRK